MTFANVALFRTISQENEVRDYLVVQAAVFGLFAVEKQEWVDEEREVVHKRNVEGSEALKRLLRNSEVLGKERRHSHPHSRSYWEISSAATISYRTKARS